MDKKDLRQFADLLIKNGYISKEYKYRFTECNFDKGLSKFAYDMWCILCILECKNLNIQTILQLLYHIKHD